MRLLPVLAVLALAVTPAAKAVSTFSLPSGRLMCMYTAAGEYGGTAAERLECQIRNPTYATPRLRSQDKRPNGLPSSATTCKNGFPHGDYLALKATGEAYWACHSEPLMPLDGHRTLAYGKTWRGGTLTCTSSTSGIRCHNKAGHGFELSRSRYRLF